MMWLLYMQHQALCSLTDYLIDRVWKSVIQLINCHPLWVLCSGDYTPKELKESQLFILINEGTLFSKVPGKAGMVTLYGARINAVIPTS